MASPVRFPGQNHKFTAPKCMSDDECGSLPARLEDVDGHITYFSCWKLTEEELKEVARTGVIWIGAVSMQPPLIVSGTRPFETPKDHHNT